MVGILLSQHFLKVPRINRLTYRNKTICTLLANITMWRHLVVFLEKSIRLRLFFKTFTNPSHDEISLCLPNF